MLCGGLAMLVAAITRSTIVALVIPVLLVQVLDRFRPGQYGWGGYFPNNLIGTNGANNVELVNVFGVYLNQMIISKNPQFTGISARQQLEFTTHLLLTD